jgi:hypothetical protein
MKDARVSSEIVSIGLLNAQKIITVTSIVRNKIGRFVD